MAFSTGFMVFAGVAILTCRNVIGHAFSSEPDVVATMALIAPYAALFQARRGEPRGWGVQGWARSWGGKEGCKLH